MTASHSVRRAALPIAFALGAATLTAGAAGAATTTIDFDRLHDAGGSYTYVSGPYGEDGFTLTAERCEPNAQFGPTCFVTPLPFNSIDRDGAALMTQYQSQYITVTRDNGALFSLASIDFSESFDNLIYNPFVGVVDFAFTYADGTSATEQRTYSNDGRFVRNTLTFNTARLTSFRFRPNGGIQFDDIVLNDIAAPVPEPATWAMMIGGFGLAGGALRRRRAGTFARA